MMKIRIVCMDYYMHQPIPGLDVCNSEFRGSSISKLPIIRIFGSTHDGVKACLHVHGVFPYIYIPYEGDENPNALSYQIASSLDKAINVSLGQMSSNQEHVYKIVPVSAFPFYGYHAREQKFFKIFFYNPLMVKKASALLQNASVLNQIFQPHEAHIPFHQQFMIDYNLHGMSFINLSEVKFRYDEKFHENIPKNLILDVKKASKCQMECDCFAENILNRLDVTSDNLSVNPGLLYICEDEKQRRRDQDEDSILTQCLTLNRVGVKPTVTHLKYRIALEEKLRDLQTETDSDSTSISLSNTTLLEEHVELLYGLINGNEVEEGSVLSQHFEEESDNEADLTLPLGSLTTPSKILLEPDEDDDIWNDSFFTKEENIPQLDGQFDEPEVKYNLRRRNAIFGLTPNVSGISVANSKLESDKDDTKKTSIPKRPLKKTATPEEPLKKTSTLERLLKKTSIPEKPLKKTLMLERPLKKTAILEGPLKKTVTPEEPGKKTSIPEERDSQMKEIIEPEEIKIEIKSEPTSPESNSNQKKGTEKDAENKPRIGLNFKIFEQKIYNDFNNLDVELRNMKTNKQNQSKKKGNVDANKNFEEMEEKRDLRNRTILEDSKNVSDNVKNILPKNKLKTSSQEIEEEEESKPPVTERSKLLRNNIQTKSSKKRCKRRTRTNLTMRKYRSKKQKKIIPKSPKSIKDIGKHLMNDPQTDSIGSSSLLKNKGIRRYLENLKETNNRAEVIPKRRIRSNKMSLNEFLMEPDTSTRVLGLKLRKDKENVKEIPLNEENKDDLKKQIQKMQKSIKVNGELSKKGKEIEVFKEIKSEPVLIKSPMKKSLNEDTETDQAERKIIAESEDENLIKEISEKAKVKDLIGSSRTLEEFRGTKENNQNSNGMKKNVSKRKFKTEVQIQVADCVSENENVTKTKIEMKEKQKDIMDTSEIAIEEPNETKENSIGNEECIEKPSFALRSSRSKRRLSSSILKDYTIEYRRKCKKYLDKTVEMKINCSSIEDTSSVEPIIEETSRIEGNQNFGKQISELINPKDEETESIVVKKIEEASKNEGWMVNLNLLAKMVDEISENIKPNVENDVSNQDLVAQTGQNYEAADRIEDSEAKFVSDVSSIEVPMILEPRIEENLVTSQDNLAKIEEDTNSEEKLVVKMVEEVQTDTIKGKLKSRQTLKKISKGKNKKSSPGKCLLTIEEQETCTKIEENQVKTDVNEEISVMPTGIIESEVAKEKSWLFVVSNEDSAQKFAPTVLYVIPKNEKKNAESSSVIKQNFEPNLAENRKIPKRILLLLDNDNKIELSDVEEKKNESSIEEKAEESVDVARNFVFLEGDVGQSKENFNLTQEIEVQTYDNPLEEFLIFRKSPKFQKKRKHNGEGPMQTPKKKSKQKFLSFMDYFKENEVKNEENEVESLELIHDSINNNYEQNKCISKFVNKIVPKINILSDVMVTPPDFEQESNQINNIACQNPSKTKEFLNISMSNLRKPQNFDTAMDQSDPNEIFQNQSFGDCCSTNFLESNQFVLGQSFPYGSPSSRPINSLQITPETLSSNMTLSTPECLSFNEINDTNNFFPSFVQNNYDDIVKVVEELVEGFEKKLDYERFNETKSKSPKVCPKFSHKSVQTDKEAKSGIFVSRSTMTSNDFGLVVKKKPRRFEKPIKMVIERPIRRDLNNFVFLSQLTENDREEIDNFPKFYKKQMDEMIRNQNEVQKEINDVFKDALMNRNINGAKMLGTYDNIKIPQVDGPLGSESSDEEDQKDLKVKEKTVFPSLNVQVQSPIITQKMIHPKKRMRHSKNKIKRVLFGKTSSNMTLQEDSIECKYSPSSSKKAVTTDANLETCLDFTSKASKTLSSVRLQEDSPSSSKKAAVTDANLETSLNFTSEASTSKKFQSNFETRQIPKSLSKSETFSVFVQPESSVFKVAETTSASDLETSNDDSIETLKNSPINLIEHLSLYESILDQTLENKTVDGFCLIIPKYNPPSKDLIVSTMETYKIHPVENPGVYYSDPKHASKPLEVGQNVLSIRTKNEYPNFNGTFPGLLNYQKEILRSLEIASKDILKFKLSHTGNSECLLQPAFKPPTCKEVMESLNVPQKPRLVSIRQKVIIPVSPNHNGSDDDDGDGITISPMTPPGSLSNPTSQDIKLSGDSSIYNSHRISGPSLNNTHGFKMTLENYQGAKSLIEHQYITILVMELHVQTRGNFKPDPHYDSIRAIFYSLFEDKPGNNNKIISGTIIVNDVLSSPTKIKPETSLFGLVEDVKVRYVKSETDLFTEFIKLVTDWDPDMVVGYEIEMQSWGYLIERGYTLGLNVVAHLGRIFDTTRPEKQEENLDTDVHFTGRIVLNLWRIMRHEIALQSYTFENIVYHILHQRVPYYSTKDLTNWWNHNNPKIRLRVAEHFLFKTVSSLRLLKHFDIVGRNSELSRLFGILFYEVLSRGSQFRVESMMLRLAKPLNYIPVSPSVQQRANMRAPEFLPLILEPQSKLYTDPVIVLDFQSLYPSMIIAYNYCFSTCIGRIEHLGTNSIFPFGATSYKISKSRLSRLLKNDQINFSPCGIGFVKKDVRLGILPRMLQEILDTRLMVKKSMKKTGSNKTLYRILHSRQLGLKLIANVTYGYTAANFSGRMPAVEVGDSVVAKGRETLQRAINLVEKNTKWGAKVVYGDTDSIFVMVPGRNREDAFKIGAEIAEEVTNDNPSPVKLKLEKVYQPCILQTKKRYVGYMYETENQTEPVFEAKGIETVRRDGCPASSMMLEKCLRLLFDTKDVSLVRKYVTRQFQKILTGRISIQDLTFAKEFRGLSGYRPNACVPALELTRKWMNSDRRNVPRTGERVPYVIVNGPPGLPLIKLVRSPMDLINDSSLRANAIYYITKVIIPPINRCLMLLGADVNIWFNEMPRKQIQYLPTSTPGKEQRKATISQYFTTTSCATCGEQTKQPICPNCTLKPQETCIILQSKLQVLERNYFETLKICQSCCNRANDLNCISLDCPVFYRVVQTGRDLQQGNYMRDILNSILSLSF